MESARNQRSLSAPLWVVVALLLGCTQAAPTRWDEAQQGSQGNQPAAAGEVVDGAVFNQFFPQSDGEYKVVFKQEKQGMAQASLQQGGKELATLSVSDTAGNPSARDKFADTTDSIEGHPAAASGSKGLSVLVGDRFQVQVRSVDVTFGESARREWIERFDLDAIAEIDS